MPIDYLPDAQQPRRVEGPLDAPPERKAWLEFTTDTWEPTTFTQRPDLCKAPLDAPRTVVRRARLIGDAESAVINTATVLSFGLAKLFDPRDSKTPQTVEREVHANEPLIWSAQTYVYGGSSGPTVSCGPLLTKFTPEAGKRYRLEFKRPPGACQLALWEINESKVVAAPEQERWRCSEGFMGIGGGDVINQRKLPRVEVRAPSPDKGAVPAGIAAE